MTKEQFIETTKLLKDVWVLSDKYMLNDGIEKHAFTVKVMEASHWLESYFRMNLPGGIEVKAEIISKDGAVSDVKLAEVETDNPLGGISNG